MYRVVIWTRTEDASPSDQQYGISADTVIDLLLSEVPDQGSLDITLTKVDDGWMANFPSGKTIAIESDPTESA